jgi:hypothetical protein
MLQLQVALIYLATFLAKHGATWWNGAAVRLALTSGDWGRGLAPWLALHPRLCAGLTFATLAIEGSFAPLVFSPLRPARTRAVALAAGLALHTGIFLTLRVGIFSQVMPVSYLVFVSARWIDRLRWPRAAPAPMASPSRIRLAALGALFGLIAVGQGVALAGRTMPRWIDRALATLGARQDWSMFAPDAPTGAVTWSAPGVLADGRSVELTEIAIPELRSRPAFRYSRWLRLREAMGRESPGLLAAMGRTLCRRARDRMVGAPLVRLEIRARIDGGHEQLVLRQSCVTDWRSGG